MVKHSFTGLNHISDQNTDILKFVYSIDINPINTIIYIGIAIMLFFVFLIGLLLISGSSVPGNLIFFVFIGFLLCVIPGGILSEKSIYKDLLACYDKKNNNTEYDNCTKNVFEKYQPKNKK